MNIRIVNNRGKYSLYSCAVDDSGYVEELYDVVEFNCREHKDIIELIDAVLEAKNHSIIMLNSANKAMFFKEE